MLTRIFFGEVLNDLVVTSLRKNVAMRKTSGGQTWFLRPLLPGHVEVGLNWDSNAERWMWRLPFCVHFSPTATGG